MAPDPVTGRMLQHTYVPDFQGVFNLPGFLQEKISIMSIRKTMQLSFGQKGNTHYEWDTII